MTDNLSRGDSPPETDRFISHTLPANTQKREERIFSLLVYGVLGGKTGKLASPGGVK